MISFIRLPIRILIILLFVPLFSSVLRADTSTPSKPKTLASGKVETPGKVVVQKVTSDVKISRRLKSIIQATGWFNHVQVEVRQGVVFLDGEAKSDTSREWASELGKNTQDVVAVVNRLQIEPKPFFDLGPAVLEIKRIWRNFVNAIPLIILGFLVIGLAFLASKGITRIAERILKNHLNSPLLVRVLARMIAIPVLLLGAYVVLQVAGLTRLAMTILGGTGVIGIIAGFAFRDIAENFLASILLSIRQPFSTGDRISIKGRTGSVLQMNTRCTVLLTSEGNHITIPNAQVFKNVIENFSASPIRRHTFDIWLDIDSPATEAKQIIREILAAQESVLDEPAPLVLLASVVTSKIQLSIYIWVDERDFSASKTKSLLQKLIIDRLLQENIKLADETRQITFAEGRPPLQLYLAKTVSRRKKNLRKKDISGKTSATAEVLPAENEDVHQEERDMIRDSQPPGKFIKEDNLLD